MEAHSKNRLEFFHLLGEELTEKFIREVAAILQEFL